MVLTVYHLAISQSQRIIWLCEELGIKYELKVFPRGITVPAGITEKNPLAQAPVITDTGPDGKEFPLAESAAIVEYIIHKHGDGRLALGPSHPDYAKFLYWFHFANSTLQPAVVLAYSFWFAGMPAWSPITKRGNSKLHDYLAHMDEHLAKPENPYLGGGQFTAADVMIVFSLTEMRSIYPYGLTPYPHVVGYLQERIGTRAAYRVAHEKGDPTLPYMLHAAAPDSGFREVIRGTWVETVLMPARMLVRIIASMVGGAATPKVKLS